MVKMIELIDYEFWQVSTMRELWFDVKLKYAMISGVYLITGNGEPIFCGKARDLYECFAKPPPNAKLSEFFERAAWQACTVDLYFHPTRETLNTLYDIAELYAPQLEFYDTDFFEFTKRKKRNGGAWKSDIVEYLEKILRLEYIRGKEIITLTAGEIHEELSLENRLPTVCLAMKSVMRKGDEILYETPSGVSNKFCVKYYLDSTKRLENLV
jgi:hypothetical protein